MTLQQIIENWDKNKYDTLVYKTPEIKFKSEEQAKTRVISENK